MVLNIKCDLSFRCWECPKNCPTKQIFELPEPLFMDILSSTYKTIAGMMLAAGIPFEEVEKQKNIIVLTQITSRKKYLEEKQKTS